MSNKSILDIAYEVIQSCEEPISFQELWNRISEIQGYTEGDKVGRIGKFYTSLLTDGRFVNLGDNTWDLRAKYTFDKVHIDMSDCYTDEEEDEKDPEELLEEKDEESKFFNEDESDESIYEPEVQE